VNAGTTLVTHIEPAKSMQPGQRPLDDPSGATEAAAVRPRTAREHGRDAALTQLVSVPLGVIPAVALHEDRFPAGRTRPTADRRHRIHEVEQFADVVAVGGRQPRDERNPLRVGKNVMFRPGLAAIGRVRSSFFPPRSARSEALSTMARARSSSPRRRSSVSKAACSRFQTPARCQRTSRRQQVLPQPQPISFGNMFQGMPLRSTNKMPVSTARSGIGVRPACCRSRRLRFGSSGAIRVHKSSSTRAWLMPDRLAVGQATVPSLSSEYKRRSVNFAMHS